MTERMSLEKLYSIIQDRKAKMPEGSYVASLFKKGVDRMAQKVGEEGVEVAIAAVKASATGEGIDRVINETADLWFHSLVLLAGLGVSPNAVLDVLTQRHSEKK